jgi:hypothetical protein
MYLQYSLPIIFLFMISSESFMYGRKGASVTRILRELTISDDQQKEAYEAWQNINSWMKTTAPNYLTAEECSTKFQSLAVTVKSTSDALSIVKTDPTVLNYNAERVSEAYRAWLDKFEGKEQDIMALILRNPPILSLSGKSISSCGPSEIAQTQFWSYFAVVTRPLTVGIQKIFR